MAKNDITEQARAGFVAAACIDEAKKINPYLYSSPYWYAFELGRYFLCTERPMPHDVRMSRGSSVRVGDMLFKFNNGTFERIS